MPTLKEQREDARNRGLAIIDGAKAATRELSSDELAKLKDIEAEVKDFDERIERAEQGEAMFKSFEALGQREEQPASKSGDEARTLGEHFVKHVGAQLKTGNWSNLAAPEFFGTKANTDNQVTGGPSGGFEDWLVDIDRSIQRAKRERLYIADLMGKGTLSGQSVRYYLEGALEGNFATVAEGGQKPQVHVSDPTPQEDAVTKIAAWIRFTDETLEDLPFWVSEINNRLLYQLAVVEEQQLLNGNGTAPNLRGLLNRTGVQTETAAAATGGKDNPDAIFRAINKVSLATNYTADALVINPADYQSLRLNKDGNGQYFGGGYFQGQYGTGGIMENPPVWGLRTVVTPAVAAGSPVVGAFKQGSTVYRKGGVRVESTNSHGTDFTTNHVVTRVEERLALAVRQPAAFVKVTLDYTPEA